MTEDYSAYIGIGHNSSPDELLEVTKLAEEQHAIQDKIAILENGLKLAQIELKNVAENRLPEAMEKLGLSTFTTASGISVEVNEKIRCSLPTENRPKGIAWLEEQKLDPIIKSEVVVAFGRNQLEEAKTLLAQLRADNKIANLERTVHHSTLDSVLRERLANGQDVPQDIFGVYRQRVAKVEV